MIIEHLDFPEVLLIKPKKSGDHRGFFMETFREEILKEHGFEGRFVQDNHSFSIQKGTLRGLHFQCPPHAQDKLVRVVNGSILDVVVDIREGSPTFGEYVSTVLSSENCRLLLIPKGFAHGFVTLEPDTEVIYKVSDYYAPEREVGIFWNDPNIGVDWSINGAPILSERDALLPLLSELQPGIFQYGQT